jgi:hypothetical protein
MKLLGYFALQLKMLFLNKRSSIYTTGKSVFGVIMYPAYDSATFKMPSAVDLTTPTSVAPFMVWSFRNM